MTMGDWGGLCENYVCVFEEAVWRICGCVLAVVKVKSMCVNKTEGFGLVCVCGWVCMCVCVCVYPWQLFAPPRAVLAVSPCSNCSHMSAQSGHSPQVPEFQVYVCLCVTMWEKAIEKQRLIWFLACSFYTLVCYMNKTLNIIRRTSRLGKVRLCLCQGHMGQETT